MKNLSICIHRDGFVIAVKVFLSLNQVTAIMLFEGDSNQNMIKSKNFQTQNLKRKKKTYTSVCTVQMRATTSHREQGSTVKHPVDLAAHIIKQSYS